MINSSYTSSGRQSVPRTYPVPYTANGCGGPPTPAGTGHSAYTPGLNKPPYAYQSAPVYKTSAVPSDYTTSSSHYGLSCSTTTILASPVLSQVRPADDGTCIFLSGLSYHQSEAELRGTLQSYGPLVYLEIHADSQQLGKGKGTARARFPSAHQALNAIRGLDGLCIGGRKISVGPVKADGTNAMAISGPRTTSAERRPSMNPMLKNKSKRCKSRGLPASQVDNRSNTSGRHSPASSTGSLVVNGARDSAADWRHSREQATEIGKKSYESSNGSSEESSDEEEEEEEEDDDDTKYAKNKRGMHSLRF